MLWLCLHFPRLPLSALGPDSQSAAVVDQRGSQRWLITDTPASPAGTPLAQALALDAGLRVQVRKPAAEQAALQSLAYWAYRFGQPVTADIQNLAEPGRIPRALLWVEIGSSLELFGGIEALCDALFSELLELGHAAQAAMAPTRAAAALLACADTASCDRGWGLRGSDVESLPRRDPTGVREAQDRPAPAPTSLRSGTVSRACAGHTDPVLAVQDLKARLEALPITLLHWPGEVLSALTGVGFRRMAELFAVPREAFTQRFGARYRVELDQMLGLASEPAESIVPPETFRRRFELSAEIENVERLQFPLNRLCLELQAYLRTRDRGLRSVTLAVAHAGARETRIHAQFVDPHRDAKRIFDALHERLERDGLPLPARELVLMAEDLAEAVVPQSDLFDARAGQAQAWAAALERIGARLGTARIWIPQAVAEHRPDFGTRRAWPSTDDLVFQPARHDARRPSVLLPQPSPIPAPAVPEGTRFERIESGWWDGQDVRRDYMALDINGSRAWVFRDVATGTWHLHGWFS